MKMKMKMNCMIKKIQRTNVLRQIIDKVFIIITVKAMIDINTIKIP